ncbi:MAG: carboxypeptidase regulatory-like domain-containing protein [Gemmatimonadetes bacterium]|nr:carboxypeptidase regulatory-like domain-containing protein [Gemmatimonadota bacterium]
MERKAPLRRGLTLRCPLLVAVLFCAALPLAGFKAVSAQTVRGELVEEGTGYAIVGAFTTLLDEREEAVARWLTDAEGRFLLRAPGPGLYRVRVERIGYAGVDSPSLDLLADSVLPYRMAVRAEAVRLEGIEVEGERRCASRPDRNAETARVWDEARKALELAAWAERQRLFRYTVRRYVREVDPATLQVRRDSTWYHEGVYRQPFVSMSAERLSTHGYVVASEDRTVVYYAPDALVLLSEPFLEDHCFRTQAGTGRRRGLIGLAFEPIPGRPVTEVTGVLWIDRTTAELRDVEIGYTGRGLPVAGDRASGWIRFERLPSGAWIVRRWWIRMPLVRRAFDRFAGPSGREEVVTLREEGGEVVQIFTPDGELLPRE